MSKHKENESLNCLTEKIIGCAIQVHKTLGPGLLESVYEECLCCEMKLSGIKFERQKTLPIQYYDMILESGLRLDVLVENRVILEIKAIEGILPVHKAQLLTYLKLSGIKIGLLINFCVPVLKEGIIRMVNQL
jgi:GxxExxY protein